MFTLAIYTGSLISTCLMPELRHSIHCFGRDTYFPLAFGVLSIIMLTSTVILVCGKNMYVKKKPENNILTRIFGCIFGNTTEIPSGQGRIYIYNGFDCNVFVQSKSLHVQHQIGPLDMFNVSHTVATQNVSGDVGVVGITIGFETKCSFVSDNYEFNTTLTIIKGKEISYHLTRLNPNIIALNRVGIHDNLVKEKFGNPNLRILVDHTFDYNDNITLADVDHNSFTSYSLSLFRGMNFNAIKTGKYNVFYNGIMLPTPTMDIIPAAFYTITLQRNGNFIGNLFCGL
ncbi:unnamed protein product [Macrosiphum euphorbiae]|uniref:Uncharacterized protein n=1 Tax=Macrosiphum euphorbiae TaxID=13131 RepID=A0AAV0XHN5_9HEMI|nr:unnamed protein product [Macrosiphum euphorbiae]